MQELCEVFNTNAQFLVSSSAVESLNKAGVDMDARIGYEQFVDMLMQTEVFDMLHGNVLKCTNPFSSN